MQLVFTYGILYLNVFKSIVYQIKIKLERIYETNFLGQKKDS